MPIIAANFVQRSTITRKGYINLIIMEKENNSKKHFKYIVYETTNLINQKIYVGVHQTENPDVYDHYLGCGAYDNVPSSYNKAKFAFHKALIKYGPHNFRRKTLAVFDTAKAAYLLEEEIVNEEFLKRDDVYNMVLGGAGGYYISKRIEVHYYDASDGHFIGSYESMALAGLDFGCDYSAISYAVRKKTKSFGYYWNTDKMDKIDLSKYNECDNHKTHLYFYDILGNYVCEYASTTAAMKGIKTNSGAIYKSYKYGESIGKKGWVSLYKADNYSIAKTEYIKNRPVYKYSINGDFLDEYSRQEDAEKANPGSNISKSIRLKSVDSNNFMWGLEKLENYNVPKKINEKKRVGKYDLNGNIICVYESATAAAKENGTSVWKVLAGTNRTHKQYVYKYM